MNSQFTHKFTADILLSMDRSPFAGERLARMTGEKRDLITKQRGHCRQQIDNGYCSPYREAD